MDAPHAPKPLSEVELAVLLNADPERQLRLIRKSALLPALDSTFFLLDISARGLWENLRRRNPRVPVFKTIEKAIKSYDETLSKGTQKKLLHVLPLSRAAFEISAKLSEAGFVFPELVAWAQIFDASIFHSSAAAEHWLSITLKVAELNGPQLHAKECGVKRVEVYAHSEVTARLGCPRARERFLQLLPALENEANLDDHAELGQLLAIDAVATLLRIAAWWMADWQVCHWESSVSQGRENDVLCADLISATSRRSGRPTTPLQTTLEKLACKAGWTGRPKVERFLGKLWSMSDPSVDIDSRIRLLRSWLQLQKHRPSFSKLVEMTKVCQLEMARLEGLPLSVEDEDTWLPASIIRVAEVITRLAQHLEAKGIAEDMLESGFGVYEIEYRLAREALGKPIVAKET